MTRYRLPEILGGGEVDALETWGGCAGGRPEYRIEGITVTMPAGTPMEPVDTTPPEPEPGAWLIGGVLCACFVTDGGDEWVTAIPDGDGDTNVERIDWRGLWERIGGPGITPRRLVPEPVPVEVTLPWRGISLRDRPIELTRDQVDYKGVPVLRLTVDGESVVAVGPDTAERLGYGLISAARAAREATP